MKKLTDKIKDVWDDIKMPLAVGAAFVAIGSAFFALIYDNKTYSKIKESAAQVQMIEQSTTEAGINYNSSPTEILREYYSSHGLDLEADGSDEIEKFSELTLSHYNSLANMTEELYAQTVMLYSQTVTMLENIESDDQAKATYSAITENLNQYESFTEDLRRSSYEFNGLSRLLLDLYYASKLGSPKEAEKIIGLAKTIYDMEGSLTYSRPPYELEKSDEIFSEIIKLYENEEKRLEDKLKESEQDYLVKTREDIEEAKNEINSLINRAKYDIRNGTLFEISMFYDSAISKIIEVVEDSNDNDNEKTKRIPLIIPLPIPF